MKLTHEIDYAFRVINCLIEEPNRIIGANEISEQMHIPLRFLLKILRKLNAAKITNSKRGVNGGYHLYDVTKPITYLEVVEAIQGPIVINRCMNDEFSCENNKNGRTCNVHAGLARVQKSVKEALEKEVFEPKV